MNLLDLYRACDFIVERLRRHRTDQAQWFYANGLGAPRPTRSSSSAGRAVGSQHFRSCVCAYAARSSRPARTRQGQVGRQYPQAAKEVRRAALGAHRLSYLRDTERRTEQGEAAAAYHPEPVRTTRSAACGAEGDASARLRWRRRYSKRARVASSAPRS